MRAAKRTLEDIPPLLLTQKEVATILRYGESRTDEMVRDGSLAHLGTGRDLRITYESCQRWVKQQSTMIYGL